jgi:hypothetical protein
LIVIAATRTVFGRPESLVLLFELEGNKKLPDPSDRAGVISARYWRAVLANSIAIVVVKIP